MDGMGLRRIRRHIILITGCVAFLVGVALAQRLHGPSGLIVTLISAVAIASMRPQTRVSFVLVLLACLSFGLWRGAAYVARLAPYEAYYDRKIVASMVAQGDAVYGTKKQLSFDAGGVLLDGVAVPGKVGVSGFGENMVFQGDTVVVTGSFRRARGSYKGRFSYATMHVVRHGGTVVDRWRRRFGAALTSVLPEPLAPFGMGLLIGQRNTLPEATSNTLLWVGLTHIIAVSGYNLTVLLQAARRVLGRGSKYQIVVASIGLMGVFLLFAGNSPSIVRAAIISTIGLLAWYYGRRLNPVLLITLAACMTAYANPSYVWSDSGWYLSFLAFFGVVVIAPAVHQRAPPRIGRSILGAMVIETLCAEAMTAPYVVHIFGQASLVSLPANILIASFVPVAMLATLIAGLAAVWLPIFAGWFAWPANLILNYMLDGCQLLSRVPHTFIDNTYITTSAMACCYAAIGVAYVAMRRHDRIGRYEQEERPP